MWRVNVTGCGVRGCPGTRLFGLWMGPRETETPTRETKNNHGAALKSGSKWCWLRGPWLRYWSKVCKHINNKGYEATHHGTPMQKVVPKRAYVISMVRLWFHSWCMAWSVQWLGWLFGMAGVEVVTIALASVWHDLVITWTALIGRLGACAFLESSRTF